MNPNEEIFYGPPRDLTRPKFPTLSDIGEQFQKIAWILFGFALLFFVMGFLADATQAWANVLLTAFNLTCVGLGGLFLLAIQSITGARWSDPILKAHRAMPCRNIPEKP